MLHVTFLVVTVAKDTTPSAALGHSSLSPQHSSLLAPTPQTTTVGL